VRNASRENFETGARPPRRLYASAPRPAWRQGTIEGREMGRRQGRGRASCILVGGAVRFIELRFWRAPALLGTWASLSWSLPPPAWKVKGSLRM